jgi:MFS family permease
MGWSRTATNAALSLGLLISGLAAWPIGIWIDHGHGRKVATWGAVLGTAMLVLWSQAESLVTLFVAWIGLGVAMAATLYDPVFAIVTRRFPDSFRKRITLITLVGGFASTVFIPLTHGLVDALGWRQALLVLALLISHSVCRSTRWRLRVKRRMRLRIGTRGTRSELRMPPPRGARCKRRHSGHSRFASPRTTQPLRH